MVSCVCYSLEYFNDIVSSVNNIGCVILYDSSDCTGEGVKIESGGPCQANVADCAPDPSFGASSIKLCERDNCVCPHTEYSVAATTQCVD